MKNLKLFRLLCGLKQKQLAELVGSSQAAISQFERGIILPGPTLARKLSIALNRPINLLFGNDEFSKWISQIEEKDRHE